MQLDLYRFAHGVKATLGVLHINGDFHSFTCEDQYQAVKVTGETRIPAGTYRILLRNEGGMNRLYKERFTHIHKGMLWLQDVENFEFIYLHYGNTEADTAGCILTGYNANGQKLIVGRSVDAYIDLYLKVVKVIVWGGDVFITVHDNLVQY